MKKVILIGVICVIGLASGVFLKIMTVNASSPEGGCPVNVETAPTVVYDEVWEPLFALITVKDNGTYKVGELNFREGRIALAEPAGGSVALNNAVSGEITGTGAVKHLPKMRVTRWQVVGHAHFSK